MKCHFNRKEKIERHADHRPIPSFASIFRCRREQHAFDNCAKTKLNLERPEQGYFSMVRMHDSQRPMPKDPFRIGGVERHPPKMAIPDPPTLAQADEYPEAKIGMKFGPRRTWMFESKLWD